MLCIDHRPGRKDGGGMRHYSRLVVAAIAVLLGAPVALTVGGGGVAMCLGPLNVTEVECAMHTGLFSSVGLGTPALALTIALALVVLVPVGPRDRLDSVASTAIGAVAGGVLFLALWPRTLEGLDSLGQWLSVPRPLDGWALLTAVVVGAAVGFAVAAAHALIRGRRRRCGSRV
ncbi:MAG: hypothetical protein AB1627_07060 [Chloroflexota bacterium]